MTNLHTITVAAKHAGDRLDIFLSQELKISRSQAQKMIERGLIMVNGKLPKKAGYLVKDGYIIYVIPTEGQPKEAVVPLPQRGPALRRREESLNRLDLRPSDSSTSLRSARNDIKIVAETPDYVVVNKPSGILTHPTEAGEKDTLVDFLLEKYPEIENVGETTPSPLIRKEGKKFPRPTGAGARGRGLYSLRPGIVHRLDKEASGLLVVARTQEMFEHLKKQFRDRTVEKEYLALAHGKVAADLGELTFPISRSKSKDRMSALPLTRKGMEQEEGKQSLTEFFVEKRFVNFSLARVKLHTGRMHQIRVHFFAYGHPLVGDPLYFTKKQKRAWDNKLGRLFLHSTRLGFADLVGDRKVFESELPEELEEFLLSLRGA